MRSFHLVSCAVALACLLACSDDDSEPSLNWKCFEGSFDCWCTTVGPNDDVDSSDPEVAACTYTTCFRYEDFGDNCSCGPTGYQPDEFWTTYNPSRPAPLDPVGIQGPLWAGASPQPYALGRRPVRRCA